MKVIITKDFAKSLKKLKNKTLEKEIKTLIEQIQKTTSYRQILNLKKIKGTKDLYRIRHKVYTNRGSY